MIKIMFFDNLALCNFSEPCLTYVLALDGWVQNFTAALIRDLGVLVAKTMGTGKKI
jgi:hypothetical protein